MIKIIDLNGCPIEVTDLDEAIRITADYNEYRHKDKSFSDFDIRQNAYWTDMYEKLTTLKKQSLTIKISER